MANTPVAYNPTQAVIAGVTNYGTIAVGTGNLDYSSKPGGLTWWMSPNDAVGYVIAYPVPAGNRSTPQGPVGTIGFIRTGLTDSAFIIAAQKLTGQTFATAAAARTYLLANNRWTTYPEPLAPTQAYGGPYDCASNSYTVYSNTGESIGSRLFYDFALTSPAANIVYSKTGGIPYDFAPIGIATDNDGYIFSTDWPMGGCD